MNRRTLLRGAGGVAIGLPFLNVMRAREAQAQGAPKRLVTWFWGMGTIQSQWDSKGTETDFTLSRILKPFEPLKSDIVVVKGLAAQGGYGHWHTSANQTGLKPGYDGKGFEANAITLDQEIAKRLAGKTRLPYLQLGVAVPRNNDKNTAVVSWSGKAQKILAENSPYATYERLFGALEGGATTEKELRIVRARKRSVIDNALENARRLQAQLGAEDRQRLDGYFQGVRELEKKLDTPAADLPGGTCKKPVLGEMIDFNSSKNVPLLMKLQHELAVTALACDATRVITIMTDAAGTGRNHGPFIPGCDGGWHAVSHEATGASIEKMVKINIWYNQQLVSLLQMMKGTPDGATNLLDNSLVWQMPEYGANVPDGDTHQHQKLPYLLAGKCGGAIKTGRMLSFGNNLRNNHLLVSILRAMGFPDDHFNDPSAKGPLKGLGG